MATHSAKEFNEEPVDPIHKEVRLVMSDPKVRARLKEAEDRDRLGERRPRASSNEVRQRLGLPPVPGQD